MTRIVTSQIPRPIRAGKTDHPNGVIRMLKVMLLGAICLLAARTAWAEDECQPLVSYQVCWPESERLIFAGIHDGQAVFSLSDGGLGRTANLGSDYTSPDTLREMYLSETVQGRVST